jgi:hypothetical protein
VSTIYDGTPGNPTEEAVIKALSIYQGESCDGVVCIGRLDVEHLLNCLKYVLCGPLDHQHIGLSHMFGQALGRFGVAHDD